jgi:4-amino-4-deoxy-L-arabinose transferase-like glycosyltransferase
LSHFCLQGQLRSAMENRFQKMLCRVVTVLDQLGSRTRLLLLLFAVIYFLGFCLIASKGAISNDELFTLYIARLPHFRDIWAALSTGAEQTPPFFYAVSRADIKLFGTSGLALRLPELLAFALMCVCMFHIVSRRTSAVYGFLAILLPFMTTAFNYVIEARAYALVLCFSAVALLCWIWATEGRHRLLALGGLAISLAAAISSHYYSVLSIFPLALGEVVRSFRRKRVDVGVWLALVLSLSPLLAFLPLIESARKFAPHFWAKPHWSSMVYFYEHFLLTPTATPLLAILLVVIASSVFRRPVEDTGGARTLTSVPAHEMGAVLGLLLIPVVGVALAKTVVGAFSDRYALPAVIGLCIVVAWGLYSLLEARPAAAAGLGLLFCVFLAVKEVQTYRRVAAYRALQASTYSFLETYARGDAPIVISGSTAFIELTYQAPTGIAGRLLYLADPAMALRYTGTNSAEKGLLEMKHWAGLNVQSFHTFAASGRTCYIYLDNFPNQYKWTIPGLHALNWRLTLVAWQQEMILFKATPIGKASAAGE